MDGLPYLPGARRRNIAISRLRVRQWPRGIVEAEGEMPWLRPTLQREVANPCGGCPKDRGAVAAGVFQLCSPMRVVAGNAEVFGFSGSRRAIGCIRIHAATRRKGLWMWAGRIFCMIAA
jgi:hypothetical protein